MSSYPRCRFGCAHAVVRLSTPEGCACFPDDREQDLCMQHLIKAGFIGETRVIVIYDAELAQHFHIRLDSAQVDVETR